MKKLIKVLGLIVVSMFLLCACGKNIPDKPQQNHKEKSVETVMYYKTIPVKITEIRKIWCSNREVVWMVSVKSDKYKLEKSFKQSLAFGYSDPYSDDLYRGNLKVGNTIYAEMDSWKKGNKIVGRELQNLVEKR